MEIINSNSMDDICIMKFDSIIGIMVVSNLCFVTQVEWNVFFLQMEPENTGKR